MPSVRFGAGENLVGPRVGEERGWEIEYAMQTELGYRVLFRKRVLGG